MARRRLYNIVIYAREHAETLYYYLHALIWRVGDLRARKYRQRNLPPTKDKRSMQVPTSCFRSAAAFSSLGLNSDSSSTTFNKPSLECHTRSSFESPTSCKTSPHEEKNSMANEWASMVEEFPEGRADRRFFTASVKAAMRNGSVESRHEVKCVRRALKRGLVRGPSAICLRLSALKSNSTPGSRISVHVCEQTPPSFEMKFSHPSRWLVRKA